MKTQFAVVFEWAGSNYSAYVPDLPGCVSTGKTIEEVRSNIVEAIAGHIQTMRELGLEVPTPTTKAENVEVAA